MVLILCLPCSICCCYFQFFNIIFYTGRGHVIRRILRRAIRYGIHTLGAKPGFLTELIPIVAKQMVRVIVCLIFLLNYMMCISIEGVELMKSVISCLIVFYCIVKLVCVYT